MNKALSTFAGSLALFAGGPAQAAAEGAGGVNSAAVFVFLIFVVGTLLLTGWAARRTKSREAFYAASGDISPVANGLAIAGDFMSAATFLGITGLMYFVGYDAYILSTGILIGWPLMLMVIAERFRNLGRYTFVDVVTYRLKEKSIRLLAAIVSMVVVLLYLIGQMVGAGKLIELLFGVDYVFAVASVSGLMMIYVIFGGMLATTWVQMIKAVMLLVGGLVLGVALLARFDFDFSAMLAASIEKHPRGSLLIEPGGWLGGDFFNVLTVGLTMCFGVMGLPHILMRFFTVRNAAGARNSVTIATVVMSLFYILILIIGFGSVALIWGEPTYQTESGALFGGSNMVALHAAHAVGGDLLLGFMSAVTFATILAVVAGLTLAGSAAVAHDLFGVLWPDKVRTAHAELRVSRLAALGVGALALLLGVAFEDQNIAVVTALSLAIAASVNFPVLILSLYWGGLTSRGAVIAGALGLGVSLALIIVSESVWVQMLGFAEPIYPYVYPTIIAMPVTILCAWLVSIKDKSPRAAAERARFPEQFVRSEIGSIS